MRLLLYLLILPLLVLADERETLQVKPKQASLVPFRKPGQPHFSGQPNVLKVTRSKGEITTQSFIKINPKLGEWSGRVRGEGNIHLALQILRNGRIESSRYIGSVALNQESSSFHFRSPLPDGSNWNWKIVTIAPRS